MITYSSLSLSCFISGPRLLVPIVCATILILASICIFIICCYSQRKRRELLMKYTTTIAPNNEQSPNLIQDISESNNTTNHHHHFKTITHPINITPTNQNYTSYYPSQLLCESSLQTRRFLSPEFHGRRLLVHNDNNNNGNKKNINSHIPPGICTINTNRVNMNKSSGTVVI